MTMVLTLAAPRLDETLYSVIARTSRYLGNLPRRAAQTAVFGSAQVSIFDDLPVGLDGLALHARLPTKMRSGDVIANLTLLPYYAAFSTAGRHEKALVAMRGTGVWPHQVLESWINDVLPPDGLRFCRECRAEMLASFPDSWWRRTHQLPSSLVCVDHGTILQSSLLDRSMRNAGSYVWQSDALCPTDATPVTHPADPEEQADLTQLARSGDELLNSRHHRGAEDQRATYLKVLSGKGLVAENGTPVLTLVAQAIHQRWRTTLQRWDGLEDNGSCRQDWLGGLLMRKGLKSPPLHHLLFSAVFTGV